MAKHSNLLWSLGLLASGISSTTTGALTGQYLMDGIFNIKFSKFQRQLITRSIVLVPCYLIIWSVDVNKIMNFLNIIQFLQLPYVFIPLLKFAQSKILMHRKDFSPLKI